MIDPRFYQLRDHLWRATKFGYYWTSDDGQGGKFSWWELLPCTNEVPKFFYDRDAYFAIHGTNLRGSEFQRAKVADIAAINCFYFEIDCANDEEKRATLEWLAKWHIKPACVVDSGGGYHVYVWLRDTFILDSEAKRQRAIDLQWAFVEFAGGEKGVSDLARVLRIPGTYNHKPRFAPNYPPVLIVQWQPDQQYDIADLEAEVQPFIDARTVKVYAIPPKINTTLNVNDDKLLAALFRSKNGGDYRRLWEGDLSVCGGDHSKCDQYLCDGLAWVTSRDIVRMDSLFRQSGLYRDKWNREDYRKTTLEKAANSAYMDYDPFRGCDPNAIAVVEAMMRNE